MPADDIIVVEVPGLLIGSNHDVYSQGVGYIVFVRGKHKNSGEDTIPDTPDEGEMQETENVLPVSKESRVASLYRRLLYHKFITHVRKVRFGYEGELGDDVPTWMTAVSWMGGANGQIKLITSEENMEIEKG